jgi:hypothetical protein
MTLAGRSAIITGANQGLGRAIAACRFYEIGSPRGLLETAGCLQSGAVVV